MLPWGESESLIEGLLSGRSAVQAMTLLAWRLSKLYEAGSMTHAMASNVKVSGSRSEIPQFLTPYGRPRSGTQAQATPPFTQCRCSVSCPPSPRCTPAARQALRRVFSPVLQRRRHLTERAVVNQCLSLGVKPDHVGGQTDGPPMMASLSRKGSVMPSSWNRYT